MDKNNILRLGAVVLVLAVVAAFFLLSGSSPAPVKKVGDTNPNFQWFSGGAAIGKIDAVQQSDQIVIPLGSNQGNWNNTLGRDVVIDSIDLSINGTASSTFKAYVGTTTQTNTTVTDQFTLNTAPFWSQLIDGFQVATGSPIQTGATANFLTDNINSHKSNFPGKLQVPSGYNLHLMFNTFCVANGACETATSTNRGFTQMTATFWYHYRGPE